MGNVLEAKRAVPLGVLETAKGCSVVAGLVLLIEVKVVCRAVVSEDTVNSTGSIDDDTETKYVTVVKVSPLLVVISDIVDNLRVDVLGLVDVIKYVDDVGLDVAITESDVKPEVVDEVEVVIGRVEVDGEGGGVEVVEGRGGGNSGELSMLTVLMGGPFLFPSGPGGPFLFPFRPGAFVFTGSRALRLFRYDGAFEGS